MLSKHNHPIRALCKSYLEAVFPPLCCKTCACASPFSHGWWGAVGSRSKQKSKGYAANATSAAQSEAARSSWQPGTIHTWDQKTRTVSARPGRNYIPPPSPHFWPKVIFQGRGVGGFLYFQARRGRNFIHPPPLYTPPTPGNLFSWVGGWGCIKFGPITW